MSVRNAARAALRVLTGRTRRPDTERTTIMGLFARKADQDAYNEAAGRANSASTDLRFITAQRQDALAAGDTVWAADLTEEIGLLSRAARKHRARADEIKANAPKR